MQSQFFFRYLLFSGSYFSVHKFSEEIFLHTNYCLSKKYFIYFVRVNQENRKDCEKTMAQVCEICAKKPLTGHHVSHANNRTPRRWMPNLQDVRAVVNGSVRRVSVCTSCLKAGKIQKAV